MNINRLIYGFTLLCFVAQARDPFQKPDNIRCDEFTEKQKIFTSQWQFKGHSTYPQPLALMFNSQTTRWYFFSVNHVLLPTRWFISSISPNFVVLSLKAPEFCKTLIHTRIDLQ